MRERFVVDEARPNPVSDLARQVEDAFGRVPGQGVDGPFTYKSEIIDRMTDDQLDDFVTELSAASARMRELWYAIQAVYHRAPMFPLFYGLFVDAFGVTEADRILAKSGG